MSSSAPAQPIIPPFTRSSALAKVKAAQNAWNTKNPGHIALAYTEDTIWRNRDQFLRGRDEVIQFLKAKWEKEHFYVLKKELFAFENDRIAVQFFYEWNEKSDASGQWWRTYGLEDWTFEHTTGLMRKRMMSANDVRISDEDRWFKAGVERVEEVIIGEKHL